MNERELRDGLHRLAPEVEEAGMWEALHQGDRQESIKALLPAGKRRASARKAASAHARRPARAAKLVGTVAVAGVLLVALGFGLNALAERLGNDESVVVITDGSMSPGGPSEGMETSSSVAAPVTTSEPSTTLPLSAGAPGDSGGSWIEEEVPDSPTQAHAVSVSDEALLIAARPATGATLWAYLFDRDELIELPVSGTDVFQVDIDGLLAVWWEGSFEEESSTSTEQHIYAYLLPDGPKVEVAADRQGVNHPQVAGPWITWTEGTPSEDLPDEYWRMPILGVKVNAQGAPQGEPVELAPSVVAAVAGDSFFTYSLSDTHLAWEQGRAAGGLALGTQVMDLDTLQPSSVGPGAWRPSIGGDTLVYREDGLKAKDLATGQVREIDPQGDYASAAPTFVAYYRMPETAGGYEIVARGLTGGYEQVLGTPTDVPYLSPAIAASAGYVAFIAEGAVNLFKWEGR